MLSDKDDPRSRLPVSSARDTAEGGANCICYGYTGGVKANQKHVLRNPKVVIIFWGNNYVKNSNDVTAGVQLISDLVTGPFPNGLVQYGVGRGSIAGQIVIDTNPSNPAPATLNVTQAQAHIVSWINAGTVAPAPSVDEANLLYFLFPPTTTQLTENDGTTGFCGYHQHGKFNNTSHNDDLFWAIVSTKGATPGAGRAFANSVAFCASHEIAEILTNRDGQGFTSDVVPGNIDCSSQQCEIGDICEAFPGRLCCTTFLYRGWSVERYWSNWDSTCIQGDQPVSLRKFLVSIGFDFNQGLRSLNTPVIDLQYMASRE
jgi:hypothetical protein